MKLLFIFLYFSVFWTESSLAASELKFEGGNPVVLLVSAEIKSGSVEDYAREMRKYMGKVRDERGNRFFIVHVSHKNNSTKFVVYGSWYSRFWLRKHQQSEHTAEYAAAISDYLAGPPSILDLSYFR